MYASTPAMNFQQQRTGTSAALDCSRFERSYANQLSDELLLHMLDCDACLSGSLDNESINCPIHRGLMKQIAESGGPSQPLIFAY